MLIYARRHGDAPDAALFRAIFAHDTRTSARVTVLLMSRRSVMMPRSAAIIAARDERAYGALAKDDVNVLIAARYDARHGVITVTPAAGQDAACRLFSAATFVDELTLIF